MSIEHLGNVKIAAAIPSFQQTQIALDVALAFSLPDITAKLEGLLNVSAALTIQPPQLTANIEGAIAVIASLEAQLAITGPTVTLEAAAVLEAIAALSVDLGNLQAAVAFSLSIGSLLTQANINAYKYEGPVSDMGAEISAALLADPPGSPTDASTGILLTASTSAGNAALAALFF